jgi:hypothetical protein
MPPTPPRVASGEEVKEEEEEEEEEEFGGLELDFEFDLEKSSLFEESWESEEESVVGVGRTECDGDAVGGVGMECQVSEDEGEWRPSPKVKEWWAERERRKKEREARAAGKSRHVTREEEVDKEVRIILIFTWSDANVGLDLV